MHLNSCISAGRLSAVTAARAVSLFLDGDVSFLQEDGLPSGLRLLRVSASMSVQQGDFSLHLKLLNLKSHCEIKK